MITLITGLPGTGKTAFAVSELMMIKDRPIFVDGIKDLTIPHEKADSILEWHNWLPDGSILVVDEAQRIFRPRSNGSLVPVAISELETHRHKGVDIWFITQNPLLLDSNIRRLVGRHLHIRQTLLGKYIYEWQEVGDIDNKISRDLAASRKFAPPKIAFNQYKSAEIHTKQNYRIHKSLIFIPIAIIAVSLLGYKIYSSLSPKSEPETIVLPTSTNEIKHINSKKEKESNGVSPFDYAPLNPQYAYTAPAYDKLREAKSMPLPAACIATKDRCTCYTQQATPLVGFPEGECRTITLHGQFNPHITNPNERLESTPLQTTQPLQGASV